MIDMQSQLIRNSIGMMNNRGAQLKAELTEWTSEIRRGYAKHTREYEFALSVLDAYENRGRVFDADALTEDIDTALEVMREARLERLEKLTAFMRG